MRARRATVIALSTASLLAGATLLAGCGSSNDGGGGSSSSVASGGGDVRAPAASAEDKSAADGGALTSEDGGGSGTENSARVVPITRSVVYRGDITVRVKDVAAAVARAEGFATGVDGLVYGEELSTEPGRKGSSQATLTLKVPPTQFRPVLNQLGALGKQISRSQTAEDVTSKAVDVASRLRSQRASVARLQALLDKATTVGAVVQVEGELSRREADLEALEAQQKSLDELVDLATINVSLVAPDVKVAPPVKKDNLGFLSGLKGGLTALLVVVVVALTAVGAALPFLIALALVAVPVLLVLRSRRHPTPVAPAVSDG
jgi:Domain of unknown function (DUF4349)